MAWLGAAVAVVLIVVVFIDAFEAMILPRRVRHSYRLAPLFYRSAWRLWRAACAASGRPMAADGFLSIFGPLSLLGLFALWAVGLIVGFALLHWSLGTLHSDGGDRPASSRYLYFSGTTFFTLGYGDLVPTGPVRAGR